MLFFIYLPIIKTSAISFFCRFDIKNSAKYVNMSNNLPPLTILNIIFGAKSI